MSISLSFHEIGGLALLGIFLIHIVINYRWVITISKKLFSKTIPGKTKIGYVLNVTLLIAVLLIGISGIMISKVVFHISVNGGFLWKTIHYTTSAIALILIGIHVGLHKQFIANIIKKIIPLPKKLCMILGLLISIIIISYGAYNIVTTSFTNWLLMPFSAHQMEGKEMPQAPDITLTSDEKNTSNNTLPSEGQLSSDENFTPGEKPDNFKSDDFNSDKLKRDINTDGFRPDGKDFMREAGQNFGVSNALNTIAKYFSITYLFASITYLIKLLIIILKKKPKKDTAENQ